MRTNHTIIAALVLSLIILVGGSYTALAQSQSSQAHITWKASNFYPSSFAGKALPTFGTPVTVTLEVTQAGALVDLSQAEITWELDGKFLTGGRNVKRATFTASKGVGETHFVRVAAERGSSSFGTSVRIPVEAPSVSIGAPYLVRTNLAEAISLRALPFFFNVSSLREMSFQWNVEGVVSERRTGDNTLSLSLGDTFPSLMNIAVTAASIRDSSERANASLQLNF